MDYLKQLNDALAEYEQFKPYKTHSIDWICDRISWCWKWRKITEDEKNNFCDRIIYIMEDLI